MKKLLLVALLTAFPAAAQFRVIDGDTIDTPVELIERMPRDTRMSLRLSGINTPETRRAECDRERRKGEEAKEYVRRRIVNARNVRVIYEKPDKYSGRFIGRMEIDGQDLANAMIANGLAVPYHGGPRINVWCR